MEYKRNRRNDGPRKLEFELIKQITNDFSDELGRGSFGQVFKGVLEDGEEVAVKILRFMGNINDEQFQNEFEILKRLKHPNIVRLVAFCDEAQEVCIEYNGKLTVCQRIHRALCLEYMPNGSLGKLLHGENLDKNWTIRYNIIKGICEGLEYLQEGLEFPIFHLDLKPDNILLNEEMMPKISDFGLSRLIDEENSTKKTLTPLGTIGYLPPEFINYQVISKDYDIYSLGVIITKIIITGITDYYDIADMSAQEFIQHVHDKWKSCLQKMLMYASLEQYCKEVERCIEIARTCMENDRHKRPTIKDIVCQLDQDHPRIIQEPSLACTDWDESYLSDWSDGEAIYFPDLSDGKAWPSSFGSIGPQSGYKKDDGCPRLLLEPACLLPEWVDLDYHVAWENTVGTCSATDPLSTEEVESSHKVPPCSDALPRLSHKNPHPLFEICHPDHPEHKLKAMTAVGAPFLCEGCKEPGYGPRYSCDCDGGGDTFDLHTLCALAADPLFGLHTVVHPLFGYGKYFELSFLHEVPVPYYADDMVCDACGEPTRGYVYHGLEECLDLHPCCASLPDRIVHDGRAFDLHRRASRPCPLCPENEGQRRRFWAYRCNGDCDEAAVDLHVACLKETARRIWDAFYSNLPDVGGGAQINVDGMLVEDMFSTSTDIGFDDKFGEIAGTVASFITALVFGKLIVKI